MTGRAEAAPNSRIATPGASDNVAPIVDFQGAILNLR